MNSVHRHGPPVARSSRVSAFGLVGGNAARSMLIPSDETFGYQVIGVCFRAVDEFGAGPAEEWDVDSALPARRVDPGHGAQWIIRQERRDLVAFHNDHISDFHWTKPYFFKEI